VCISVSNAVLHRANRKNSSRLTLEGRGRLVRASHGLLCINSYLLCREVERAVSQSCREGQGRWRNLAKCCFTALQVLAIVWGQGKQTSSDSCCSCGEGGWWDRASPSLPKAVAGQYGERRLPGGHSPAGGSRACPLRAREASASRWLGHCPQNTRCLPELPY